MEINGLIIESVVVGSVGTNCYIVHKKDSEHCFVVDPGDSGDKIANYIRDQKMILVISCLPMGILTIFRE